MSRSLAARVPRLLHLAARALGWRPGDFWAATPPELALCLIDPQPGGEGIDREDLKRMLERDRHG